jgi:hypothetical protein
LAPLAPIQDHAVAQTTQDTQQQFARLTALRRNLFRLWIMCSLLWLACVGILVSHAPIDLITSFFVFILPPIMLLLTGLALTLISKRFGEPRWLDLPKNIRRGLTRVYLVVTVPWVAWYGYQILDASQHSSYAAQRAISHAFWSMLIVPVGGPILLLVVLWVLAGFRKSEAVAIAVRPEVKIDPRASQPQPKPTTENRQSDTRTAKPPHDYTAAGKGLGKIFFEPDVWHAMIKLHEFAANTLFASDVALARIAIIRDAIRRLEPHSVATQMLASIDQYVGEAFKKTPAATTARLAIQLFEQNVSPLTRLADVLARRLSTSGVTAVEIVPVLEEVLAEAEQLMKVSSSLQKLNEPSLMDEFVKLAHNGSPTTKIANLGEAIQLSYEVLLSKKIDISAVRTIATELYDGPLPYSTHNLAVAAALNLFRRANNEQHQKLERIQTSSKMTVLEWMKEKKVAPLLAKTFEDTLHELFKHPR